jgi:hypothetical protein
MAALDPTRCAHMRWTVGKAGERIAVAVAAVGPLPAVWLPFFRGNPADVLDLASRGSPGQGFWPLAETADSVDPASEQLGAVAETIDEIAMAVRRHQPKQARPLAEVQAERLAALADYRYRHEVSGVAIDGIAIDTDRESQGLIDSLFGVLRDQVISSVRFKSAAGVVVTCDLAVATLLRAKVTLFVQACRNREAEHIDAMAALDETSAACAAYDVTTGWPSRVISSS